MLPTRVLSQLSLVAFAEGLLCFYWVEGPGHDRRVVDCDKALNRTGLTHCAYAYNYKGKGFPAESCGIPSYAQGPFCDEIEQCFCRGSDGHDCCDGREAKDPTFAGRKCPSPTTTTDGPPVSSATSEMGHPRSSASSRSPNTVVVVVSAGVALYMMFGWMEGAAGRLVGGLAGWFFGKEENGKGSHVGDEREEGSAMDGAHNGHLGKVMDGGSGGQDSNLN